MTKKLQNCHYLVKNRRKTVNLCYKKTLPIKKCHENVNLWHEKPQLSEKKSQKCKVKLLKVTT